MYTYVSRNIFTDKHSKYAPYLLKKDSRFLDMLFNFLIHFEQTKISENVNMVTHDYDCSFQHQLFNI